MKTFLSVEFCNSKFRNVTLRVFWEFKIKIYPLIPKKLMLYYILYFLFCFCISAVGVSASKNEMPLSKAFCTLLPNWKAKMDPPKSVNSEKISLFQNEDQHTITLKSGSADILYFNDLQQVGHCCPHVGSSQAAPELAGSVVLLARHQPSGRSFPPPPASPSSVSPP